MFYVSVCVKLYEEVRRSLEQCDFQEDIEHFVNLRRTGDKPAGVTGTQTERAINN